ncbi:hypothetical protein N7513_007252 [Penicillium frequentans]|nr:hypothetical protein N7513_007252 [Penicillium glabrum]
MCTATSLFIFVSICSGAPPAIHTMGEVYFVRRSEKLHLYRIFFNYALLLATKADCNAELQLVNFMLEGDEPWPTRIA